MKLKYRFHWDKSAWVDSRNLTCSLNPFFLRISDVFFTIKPEGELLPPWFMGHVYWDFGMNAAIYSLIPVNYIWRAIIEIQHRWNIFRSKPTRLDLMTHEIIQKRVKEKLSELQEGKNA